MIRGHLLQYDINPSFDDITILTHGNKKYLVEIKESLFIKRDQLVLKKKTLAPLRYIYSTRVNVIG